MYVSWDLKLDSFQELRVYGVEMKKTFYTINLNLTISRSFIKTKYTSTTQYIIMN